MTRTRPLRRPAPRAAIRAACAFAALAAAASGCRAAPRPWPFPAVADGSREEQLAVIAARADAIRCLSALVRVAIDTSELSESLDMACAWRRPGDFYLEGSKGLLLSSRPVFELVFNGDRYAMTFQESEASGTRSSGRAAAFPADHPAMAGLFWVREAMFLAGEMASVESVETDARGRVTALEGATRDGGRVRWSVDPLTLGVEGGVLRPSGGGAPLDIVYEGYTRHGDAYLPSAVSVRGADGFRMRAVVRELEVNEEPDADLFVVDDAPRAAEAGR